MQIPTSEILVEYDVPLDWRSILHFTASFNSDLSQESEKNKGKKRKKNLLITLAFSEAAPTCQCDRISNSHQSEKQYCNIEVNKPSLLIQMIILLDKCFSEMKPTTNQYACFVTYKSRYNKTKLPADI